MFTATLKAYRGTSAVEVKLSGNYLFVKEQMDKVKQEFPGVTGDEQPVPEGPAERLEREGRMKFFMNMELASQAVMDYTKMYPIDVTNVNDF